MGKSGGELGHAMQLNALWSINIYSALSWHAMSMAWFECLYPLQIQMLKPQYPM